MEETATGPKLNQQGDDDPAFIRRRAATRKSWITEGMLSWHGTPLVLTSRPCSAGPVCIAFYCCSTVTETQTLQAAHWSSVLHAARTRPTPVTALAHSPSESATKPIAILSTYFTSDRQVG